MKNTAHNVVICVVASLLLTTLSPTALATEEVNLYSARKENLIKPLLDQFTTQTGIAVNLVTGKASALMKRLESEGSNTPADILLTVDAGRLHAAKRAGLFQPIDSTTLAARIPAQYRDIDSEWFGLSARSRVIVYSRERVQPAQLSTYEALTEDQWRGRICVRSSGNIYNQSLLASMIANDGVAAAESWAKGIVANMARSPKGNDRAQVKAVAAGECDIAIVNTYYIGKMHTAKKGLGEREAVARVAVFFPNQQGRGAHMNVSGAGVLRHSGNRANAVRLLEFLASKPAQEWYAQINHEYPVHDGVAVSEVVSRWGFPFKSDALNISKLGEYNAEAVRVFDRVGWK